MATEIYSWGGAEEVTGSKHFVHTPRALVQIDCGMFQGRRQETYEKNLSLPYDCEEVSACVLTHAHFDHSGNLPSLARDGFKGKIYATPATIDIARLILHDSAHIQASDHAYALRRKRKNPKRKGFIPEPLYDFEDVDRLMDRFEPLRYRETKEIAPGILLTFYDAGHILGSASAYFEVEEGGITRKIVFSGDLGRKNLPILRDPQHPPVPDAFVCESTYGNRLHDDIQQVDREMGEVISETAARGGKVIIPAFAVGRTQEILYCIHLLSDRGKIPPVPVFVDSPMASKATSIFTRHPECYDQETRDAFGAHATNPFGFEQLTIIRTVEESKNLNNLDGPAIIISASGMAESGRILHHLMNNIEDPRNTILVVGYMAQHTLGRRIADRNEKVKIFGEEHRLRARVKILNAFSAHADYNEIRDYMNHYSRKELRDIFLVHGELEPKKHLAGVLEDAGFRNVTPARLGERYRIE